MKRAKPAKPAKPAATRNVQPRTGRDGAIDYASKMEPTEAPVASRDAASDHVYRVIELVGTSEESIEDAIDSAVARAHRTLRNLRWFEIVRTSGHIDGGRVRHFQVTLKVGFTMEQPQ